VDDQRDQGSATDDDSAADEEMFVAFQESFHRRAA
jgi:hypothetical protein